MGSINYSRKRLQKVYTWDGHDPSQFQARATRPEKLLLGEKFLLVEDQPSFTRESTITYDSNFFQKFSSSIGEAGSLVDVTPTVLIMDATGDQAVTGALGNVFIATAPTVASVTVGASNDATGKLGIISTIII